MNSSSSYSVIESPPSLGTVHTSYSSVPTEMMLTVAMASGTSDARMVASVDDVP